MSDPTYLKNGKSIKIGMHSLISVLGEIDKMGHSDILQAHLADNNAVVSIPSRTVNLVKDYIVKNNLGQNNDVVAKVVNSDPNADPDCCSYKAH